MPFYYPSIGSTVEIGEIESLAKGVIIVGDGSGSPSTLAPGTDGYTLYTDSTQTTGLRWDVASGGGGGGEVNTASNVGTAGTGIFDAKVGFDLQLRKLNSLSTILSIALDAANKKIDFSIDQSKISISRTFALMGC